MANGRIFEHIEVEVQPDLHLLLFTAGIALITGLLFGLAPAWYAFRADPASALRQTGKGGDTWFWRLFGKGLVAAQVALSILLVTAAAVFLSHFSRMRNFDLGFRSDHVLQVKVDHSRSGYKPEQLAAQYRETLARLEAIPGVRSASISGCTPLQGCGSGSRYLEVEGMVERSEDRKRTAILFVAPRYFETLGIPLIAGRDFDFRDAGRDFDLRDAGRDFALRDVARRRVAIISAATARRFFPDVNPVGKSITVVHDSRPFAFGDDQPYEIIGVAGDVKLFELRDAPFPIIYFNMFQENHIFDQFELRTAVAPESLSGAVRRTIRNVLKAVPVTRVTTLEEQVDWNLVPEHLIATLSGFFGCVGAALAGIGLYGLLAYSVARRTNEIGIRMALGATAGGVSRLVLRDALGMVGAGLLAGVFITLWSKPLAASLVQDLKLSVGPLLLGGGAIIVVALLASHVPARRAARVDPMIALRHE
jgi:predicted permease